MSYERIRCPRRSENQTAPGQVRQKEVVHIRRDLILLRRLGFDLVETEEQYNRKRWRIRQSLERLRTKTQRRAAIRDLLSTACEQAELIGDQPLVADLKTLIRRVKRL